MSIGSVLLSLALMVVVALYVSRPLLDSGSTRRRRIGRRQSLLVQKEAVLAEIRILDFDYETGKMTDEDYEQQRSALMAEAVSMLKQLDALAGEPVGGVEPEFAETRQSAVDFEEDIEAAVARLRGVARSRQAEISGRNPVGYCPECGQPADADDKFCSRCGHKLSEPQPA